MGLDTTHNCWHGAYSAYWRWRLHLATLAGFTVTRERFDYHGPAGDAMRNAPIAYLLEHSDCDGTIPLEWQLPLAERLEELVRDFPDQDLSGHIGNWHDKTLQFAAGLRLAHELGEEVEYG